MSNVYAVVEFPTENTCQFIPSSWLIKNNKFCVYPKVSTFKANELARKLTQPNLDGEWEELEVRVLTYTDTESKARRKAITAEYTSTLETEDEKHLNSKRRRRTTRYNESSDEKSSLASTPPPPVVPLKRRKFSKVPKVLKNRKVAKTLFQTQEQSNVKIQEPYLPLISSPRGFLSNIPRHNLSQQYAAQICNPILPSGQNTTVKVTTLKSHSSVLIHSTAEQSQREVPTIAERPDNRDTTYHHPQFILAPGSGRELEEELPGRIEAERNQIGHNTENVSLLDTIGDEGQLYISTPTDPPYDEEIFDTSVPLTSHTPQLHKNVAPVSEFEKTVLRILSVMQEDIRKLFLLNSKKVDVASDNFTFPVALPLTTEDNFIILNNWLAELPNQHSVIDSLKLIGGETKEDVIRNLLHRIIGPNLNSALNFTGKFNKRKLKGTKVFEVIKCTARLHKIASELTDSEIKGIVQRWLNGHKDRDGGRRRRQNEVAQNREASYTTPL